MDLNKVQLIWNVTQDIELKQTPTWQSVCNFSLATNRSWTDQSWIRQEQTEFHSIVLWWKLAEIAWRYLRKWRKVYIEWRLQTRSWEAQDWTKRYKTEIIWENMIMLDWNRQETSNAWNFENETPVIKKNSSKEEEEISIEDIPF